MATGGNTNETVVEVVRFTESGLDELTARTRTYAEQVDEATRRTHVLAGAVNDPAFLRHTQQLAQVNRQYDLLAMKARNVTLRADLQSGAFYRNAVAVAHLNKEHKALQKEAGLLTLVAEHGKLGALL